MSTDFDVEKRNELYSRQKQQHKARQADKRAQCVWGRVRFSVWLKPVACQDRKQMRLEKQAEAILRTWNVTMNWAP